MHRERERIERAGAALAFVGNGSPTFARAFREDLSLLSPVYVDTGLRAYAALGMKRGVAAALASVSVLASAARAMRAGFRQKAVQGDAWQLGGVFVVAPGGERLYGYVSDAAGDHPPIEAVLASISPTTRPRRRSPSSMRSGPQ